MLAKVCSSCLRKLLLVVVFVSLTAVNVSALPWDTDMFKQQSLKPNEVNRSPAKNTVAVGAKPFLLNAEEAAAQLKNPLPADLETVWRGRRLWKTNCQPCHGPQGNGGTFVGIEMKVPNLLVPPYSQREDGRIFAVVHHGQAGMPRYGYKFSDPEVWSIINYLRFLQGKDVAGMKRVSQPTQQLEGQQK